jgi:hypothetical protein
VPGRNATTTGRIMIPAQRRPVAPATPVLLDLPCDRCGTWFPTNRLSLECPGCLSATKPYEVVIGFARPTPLIRPVGATA